MTARVITDPSALGWVLDPDTGRWEWSGSGDGGGSGGGGGSEWELLDSIDVAGASALDYPNFTDEFMTYRLDLSNLYAVTGSNFRLALQLYENGSLKGPYRTGDFDPGGTGTFNDNRSSVDCSGIMGIYEGLFGSKITFSGVRPSQLAFREAVMPYLINVVSESALASGTTRPSNKLRQVTSAYTYSAANASCDGFYIDFNNGSTGSVKSGTANIYGKRD
jgi:hypothetical protein